MFNLFNMFNLGGMGDYKVPMSKSEFWAFRQRSKAVICSRKKGYRKGCFGNNNEYTFAKKE